MSHGFFWFGYYIFAGGHGCAYSSAERLTPERKMDFAQLLFAGSFMPFASTCFTLSSLRVGLDKKKSISGNFSIKTFE